MIRVNPYSTLSVAERQKLPKQSNRSFKGAIAGTFLGVTGLGMSRYMYLHGQMPNANTPGLLLSTMLMACMITTLFIGAARSFWPKKQNSSL